MCVGGPPHLLTDFYAAPLIKIIKEQQKLPTSSQVAHIQPRTILSKLGSLKIFLDFILSRRIFAGMSAVELEMTKLKIKEISQSLKPFVFQREADLKIFKKLNILTKEHIFTYFNSKHVLQIRNQLKDASLVPNSSTVIDTRDYLMIMICLLNATRASNLINITLKDIDDIFKDPEFEDAFCISSTRYKTSMLYGTKIMVVDEQLKNDLLQYIKTYLPVLTPSPKDRDCRYFFSTARKEQILLIATVIIGCVLND